MTTVPVSGFSLREPPPMRPEDEALKQVQLRRMKRLASGMLLVATAIFIASRLLEPRYPWLAFVRATAEAAMIGGLADWFAVTALFRHPLGIPIPHTAIVPARKDQVGRSLGNFVQRNFVSREVIAYRLREWRVAEHLAKWLAETDNSRRIARAAARGLATGSRMLRDEDVQHLIGTAIDRKVRDTQVAPILGRLLSLLTHSNRHQELFDELIALLSRAVERNEELIRQRIARESPWWIPEAVDDRIHVRIVAAIERTLTEVRDDPEHQMRARFDAGLRDFIERLQHDPQVIEKAEALKVELLNAEVVRRFSASLWTDAQEALERYATERSAPDADETEGPVERGLTAFGQALLTDPALMDKVDRWIAEVALHVVERYQEEVSNLIA
ncbi:MAG: DUF445 family protein, partial [Gemmatimonadota bacterium]|nr:DUF445 family protein [Gemmatimonadota bacterium]